MEPRAMVDRGNHIYPYHFQQHLPEDLVPYEPLLVHQGQGGRRLGQVHSSLIQSLKECLSHVGMLDVNVVTHQCHCPLKSPTCKGMHWLGLR